MDTQSIVSFELRDVFYEKFLTQIKNVSFWAAAYFALLIDFIIAAYFSFDISMIFVVIIFIVSLSITYELIFYFLCALPFNNSYISFGKEEIIIAENFLPKEKLSVIMTLLARLSDVATTYQSFPYTSLSQVTLNSTKDLQHFTLSFTSFWKEYNFEFFVGEYQQLSGDEKLQEVVEYLRYLQKQGVPLNFRYKFGRNKTNGMFIEEKYLDLIEEIGKEENNPS